MLRILYGDEPYLIQLKKQEIISKISFPELNLMRFSSWSEEVLGYIETCPMMDDYKVAVVECQTLSSFGDKSFQNYLENPYSSSFLLIIVEAIDSRTKLVKTLKEKGCLEECGLIKDRRKLRDIILTEISNRGGSISDEAYKRLLDREQYVPDGGTNLLKIISDIDRLISYDTNITVDTVDLLIEENVIVKVFSLGNMIYAGNTKELVKQARQITDDGSEEIFKSLGGLLYGLKTAWKSKHYTRKEMGLYPNQDICFGFYTEEQLLESVKLITDMQVALKNNAFPIKSAMEYVLMRLVEIKKAGNSK